MPGLQNLLAYDKSWLKHVVYAMFPIIYDIAIKENIRPERPMASASVASQMGVCASPASVAVVSVVAILASTTHPFGVVQILAISIPASFCGALAAGLWSLNRGKDLDQDPDFLTKIADPEQKAFIYGEYADAKLSDIKLPSTAYRAAGIFLIGILIIAIFGSFPELLPKIPNAKGILLPLSMHSQVFPILKSSRNIPRAGYSQRKVLC